MVRDRPGAVTGSLDKDFCEWREQALAVVLRTMLVLGAVGGGTAAYYAYASGDLWQIAFLVGGYALLVMTALWERLSSTIRACVLLSLLCGTGVLALALSRQGTIAVSVLPVVPFLAWILLGRRAAFAWWGLTLVALAVCGGLYLSGAVVFTPGQERDGGGLGRWVIGSVGYAAFSLLPIMSADHVLRQLVGALHNSRQLASELASQRTGLRLQVAERTMDLELRAQYLEAITEVTRSATAILDDPQGLLAEVVDLISERFGFYHTGVFLLDRERIWAELRAASSETGRLMVAQGYRLRVGGEETVAQVVASGVPRIARQVDRSATTPDMLHLSDAQSEIVLPLRVRGETIGALDVHSTETAAFTDDDITVLQILADQVAIALSNAHLFRQVQDSVEAMRKAYGEMGLEAWRALLQSRGGVRVRQDPYDVLPQSDLSALAHKARQEGEAVVQENGHGIAAVPIKVRGGHVIGTLEALKREGEGRWTADELGLLTSLVDQLGVSLDGAQLYQESQRRAERERVIAEVSARMRETLNTDAVLRTAIRQIGEVLNLAEVEVRMKGEAEAER